MIPKNITSITLNIVGLVGWVMLFNRIDLWLWLICFGVMMVFTDWLVRDSIKWREDNL